MSLPASLTPLQRSKLAQAGLDTTYKLITYLPSKFGSIVRLDHYAKQLQTVEKVEYCALVSVVDYSILGGGRGIRVSLETKELGRVIGYSFLPIKFVIHRLQSTTEQYCILKKSGEFWNIESFASTDPLDGKATKLVTQYAKIGGLTSMFFRSLYKRLRPEDWCLNLAGLVPNHLSIPQVFSMRGIHLPANPSEYSQTLEQYHLFVAFLDLCTIRWFHESQKQLEGPESHITQEVIKTVIQAHLYQLSPSQDTLVHYYLNKLKSVDKS